jgi:hypothetical protein
VRSGDGLFTIRFADLHHRAMQTGGLLSWRSTPWQAKDLENLAETPGASLPPETSRAGRPSKTDMHAA